ncbi:MAG: hypothetical protein EXX96DRAFT_550468 [Benjaminiella poitrasii]|nr:MAG: hypothetical protein EXX96DRAFT_550468 [Benjaminiella poitrasii]
MYNNIHIPFFVLFLFFFFLSLFFFFFSLIFFFSFYCILTLCWYAFCLFFLKKNIYIRD